MIFHSKLLSKLTTISGFMLHRLTPTNLHNLDRYSTFAAAKAGDLPQISDNHVIQVSVPQCSISIYSCAVKIRIRVWVTTHVMRLQLLAKTHHDLHEIPIHVHGPWTPTCHRLETLRDRLLNNSIKAGGGVSASRSGPPPDC